MHGRLFRVEWFTDQTTSVFRRFGPFMATIDSWQGRTRSEMMFFDAKTHLNLPGAPKHSQTPSTPKNDRFSRQKTKILVRSREIRKSYERQHRLRDQNKKGSLQKLV